MRMSEAKWLLEHSEVTAASHAFVWKYWTDVTNWADPPARFTLDGPFEAGSRGVTVLPDRDPLTWVIEEVQPGHSYTIGSELDGAVLLCHWRFDPLPGGGTRLTQRIGVAGRKRGPTCRRRSEDFRAHACGGNEAHRPAALPGARPG